MNQPWPTTDIDPIRRLRVLAAGVSGAVVAEGFLPEAYEAVEEGRMRPEQFRDFAFTNAVLLHGGMDPSFFEGTACQEAAEAVLEEVGRTSDAAPAP